MLEVTVHGSLPHLLCRSGVRRTWRAAISRGCLTVQTVLFGGCAALRRSGVSCFFGPDQQGSARILASSAGSVTDIYSYKALSCKAEAEP
ncbi:MAG: hypothetical protein KGJ62_13970 [Armatimonadetes bacterium]|nr:hypothetical protein [Armatimonadota bacterium]MDE2206808.1 hypothetical protein [Armatimonadota bacterium]